MPTSASTSASRDNKFHSEIGAPNIPPLDSVRLMMPENALWPQALDWGLHDFCLQGAQGGAALPQPSSITATVAQPMRRNGSGWPSS